MNQGFLGFKAIGWGAAALFAAAAIMPSHSLRISANKDASGGSEMQRRGLLKKMGSVDTGTTTGTTAPAPTTSTTDFIYPQATTIPSEFSPSTAIFASYQPVAATDGVGAFRFLCSPGQLSYDDPLVFPGQPGKSHLHQFYGNLNANASSTYESLRTSGYSSCGDPHANPANRSAYWIPALLDGKGNVVQPDWVQLYYKRSPKTSTGCTSGTYMKACTGLPNGLRFIFGYDMLSGNNPLPFRFICGATGTEGSTLAAALANCPAGSTLDVRQDAPDCWDGKNLDTANHRDHLAYMSSGWWGYQKCPDDHPIGIPTLTLVIEYHIASGDNPSLWRFSSDAMHPELPAGSTMHADYFEAWDPTIKAMWTDNCIDKMLSCVGGALGNGYSIIDADTPTYYVNGTKVKTWTAPQHLVPVPK